MTPTVDLLVNAAPTISTIPRSRFRRRVTADAYTAMGLLADHLLAELQAGRTDELDAVLTEAEHLVQSDYQPNIHTVGTGLIEGLHHGVSHLQDSVEPLLANRLPPRCRTLWEESRALHRDIAIWRSSTEPQPGPPVDPSMFEVEVPELRAVIRSTYWRSPEGQYIGTADAIEFQVAQTEPPDTANP